MKELLKELGFEHLPMLSEFVNSVKNHYDIMNNAIGLPVLGREVIDYTNFITQPLTKAIEDDKVVVVSGYVLEGTIEQAINAGVKLKLI